MAVDFIAEAPELVWRAADAFASARSRERLAVRFAITMHPEHGRKSCELKPSDQALAKGWIAVHAAVKSPDISRPPRNACEAHIQASGELIAQRLKA
mgnify:CR=1 FL=1